MRLSQAAQIIESTADRRGIAQLALEKPQARNPMDSSSPSPTAPAPTVVIQQRDSMFGRYGKILIVLLIFCVLSMMGMAAAYQQYFGDGEGPNERYHSLNREAEKKIAIVKVSGAIMEGDDFVEKQLKRVKKDDSVVAVVLRIDSPGGTVTYSDRLYHKTCELVEEREIPLVVSMGSICASGGYYLAMAVGDVEESIFAEPTTWTGSIGVVIPHYNFARIMGMAGVQDQSITSGDLKLMGSPTRAMSDEDREVLQTLVDESFEGFKKIVRSGRPILAEDEAVLDSVTTGQIFTAGQALEIGLVDELGFIEAAIERAAELADVSTDSVRCVEYKKQTPPIEQILGIKAPARPASAQSFDLRAVFELSSPRAYYLYTLLPTLLDASR